MKKSSTISVVFQLFAGLLLLAPGCYPGTTFGQKKATPATTQQVTPAFTYKIIPAANGTFGYDVYADGKLKIHQPSVPAVPGNTGFATQAAAEKVAVLAISKMKQGESLPTISPDELRKLGAI